VNKIDEKSHTQTTFTPKATDFTKMAHQGGTYCVSEAVVGGGGVIVAAAAVHKCLRPPDNLSPQSTAAMITA